MNTEQDLTELDEIFVLKSLMPVDQASKFVQAIKTAGAYFRKTVVEDAIKRTVAAWEGLPYANENSPTTAPDNIAWLHYYTPTEDWLVTRRFFEIRDGMVSHKPMFYAAKTYGHKYYTDVTYGHYMLDDIKARNARLDLYWAPMPVNDALRHI